MKLMLEIVLGLCLFALGHHYKPLRPLHDIPAGAIIQASDFDPHRYSMWSMSADVANDPKEVAGHKALKPLRANADFHLSDISR